MSQRFLSIVQCVDTALNMKNWKMTDVKMIDATANEIYAVPPIQPSNTNTKPNSDKQVETTEGASRRIPADYQTETYYNYNSKGERVQITQIGNIVDIIVL